MMRKQLTRRDFLARFAGNGLLALGGSLLGTAGAYALYRQRAEAGIAQLKRGTLVVSAPAANPPQQSLGANSPQQSPAKAAERGAAAPSAQSAGQASVTAIAAPSTIPEDARPVRLTIQAIGLVNAPIVPTGTRVEKGELVWDVADHAVGYLVGTGLPGRPGNLVLSGHISAPLSGQGNIFHDLPSLANKLGARVAVQAASGTWYYYQITGTDVVLPTDNWVLNPTPAPTITLLTCYPDGVYDHRFVAQGTYLGHG